MNDSDSYREDEKQTTQKCVHNQEKPPEMENKIACPQVRAGSKEQQANKMSEITKTPIGTKEEICDVQELEQSVDGSMDSHSNNAENRLSSESVCNKQKKEGGIEKMEERSNCRGKYYNKGDTK